MSKAIDFILSELDVHPVLVEVGASGEPFALWDEIAQHAVYVGFDPDLREIHEIPDGRFYRGVIVNEAITSDPRSDEALFYLTRSPYCSSTLKPDTESLSNYTFSDLFIVEKEARVRAATLDSVLDRLALSRIDWFKTDSQGIDLRIFKSLRHEVHSRVLAVDIEPGLIDAYVGEDLFVDAHRELTRTGFWLSNIDVCGTIRMRNSTLSELATSTQDLNPEVIEKVVRQTPCWVEARYLRTLDSLVQAGADRRDFALTWVFTLIDGQLGFALDLATEYEKVFGKDHVSQTMKDEPLRRIRSAATQPVASQSIAGRGMGKLKRILSR